MICRHSRGLAPAWTSNASWFLPGAGPAGAELEARADIHSCPGLVLHLDHSPPHRSPCRPASSPPASSFPPGVSGHSRAAAPISHIVWAMSIRIVMDTEQRLAPTSSRRRWGRHWRSSPPPFFSISSQPPQRVQGEKAKPGRVRGRQYALGTCHSSARVRSRYVANRPASRRALTLHKRKAHVAMQQRQTWAETAIPTDCPCPTLYERTPINCHLWVVHGQSQVQAVHGPAEGGQRDLALLYSWQAEARIAAIPQYSGVQNLFPHFRRIGHDVRHHEPLRAQSPSGVSVPPASRRCCAS